MINGTPKTAVIAHSYEFFERFFLRERLEKTGMSKSSLLDLYRYVGTVNDCRGRVFSKLLVVNMGSHWSDSAIRNFGEIKDFCRERNIPIEYMAC